MLLPVFKPVIRQKYIAESVGFDLPMNSQNGKILTGPEQMLTDRNMGHNTLIVRSSLNTRTAHLAECGRNEFLFFQYI
jgi:hypothetical protein